MRHQASHHLTSWFEIGDRFEDFVTHHRDKIRKKVRTARTNEDSSDVLAELFVAHLLLLDKRIEVEYEKFGFESRGPDISAIFDQSTQFNVEVARIRRAEIDLRFDNFLTQLERRVNAGPSNIEFDIRSEVWAVTKPLIQRLEQASEEIAQYIESTIEREGDNLSLEINYHYPIPGFEDKLTLVLFKHSFEPEPGETAFLTPIRACCKNNSLRSSVVGFSLRS